MECYLGIILRFCKGPFMYIKERKRSNLLMQKTSTIEFIMMIGILLAAMNFINRYYFCVFIAFFVFLTVPGRRLKIDISFIILMLLSASMLIFDKESLVNFNAAFKPFVFPLCYIWGRSFIKKEAPYEEHTKKISVVAFILALGCLIHFTLNYIINQGADDRNTIDFWTGMVMSATGQATIACISIGVAVAYLFSEVNWKKKLFAVVTLVIVVLYNLILSGRTIIVFTLILVAFAYLFRMVIAKKGRFRTVVVLILAAFLLYWLYNQNIFGIKEVFEDSLLYDRFFAKNSAYELNEDTRAGAKAYYLKHMWEYPFGGEHLLKNYGGRAHDLYFDTHDAGGIIAFISVCVYSLITISRAVQVVRCKALDFNTKQLLICFYIILHMQFWTEPILAGLPWTFASFCLVDGFVATVLEKHKDETQIVSKFVRDKKARMEKINGYNYRNKIKNPISMD